MAIARRQRRHLLTLVKRTKCVGISGLTKRMCADTSAIQHGLTTLRTTKLIHHHCNKIRLINTPTSDPLGLHCRRRRRTGTHVTRGTTTFLGRNNHIFISNSSAYLRLTPCLARAPNLAICAGNLRLYTQLKRDNVTIQYANKRLIPQSLTFTNRCTLRVIDNMHFSTFFFSYNNCTSNIIASCTRGRYRLHHHLLGRTRTDCFLYSDDGFSERCSCIIYRATILATIIDRTWGFMRFPYFPPSPVKGPLSFYPLGTLLFFTGVKGDTGRKILYLGSERFSAMGASIHPPDYAL